MTVNPVIEAMARAQCADECDRVTERGGAACGAGCDCWQDFVPGSKAALRAALEAAGGGNMPGSFVAFQLHRAAYGDGTAPRNGEPGDNGKARE